MRYCLITLALLSSGLQAADKPLQVPPPPPVPAGVVDEASIEPEVTIIQKGDATVSEYRLAGRLYMIKVKPQVGPEYYLSDEDGTGRMVRRDGQPTVRPPKWIIKRF
ncbi:DUF2782 domain-containing protein [Chitinimonas sp. BJB300]|uniref:DUF2782 domain-containing protein n=1 Tax=Chitinimonas sp. BJB300 TaxID=1559339 RepID=UPI000C0FB161|nr:DUF2782 domain-containing protein [Chitinimonas sp. BJB300]PHV12743.1 hypothetical protein CSQ89_04215 [Chitinimonas sp. BJB300]TSJ90922.1 DUF2782 domain-containing protein [Chitinimonas sp. BJB300]